MKQLRLTILFLILNFGGLAIGSWLMNNGPLTAWYTNLNQAPWTPPGIIFGFKGTSKNQSLVANIASIPHDPNEVDKIDCSAIKYEWEKI